MRLRDDSMGSINLCSGERANERMQLTWLIGAPSWPVSVHRRACGRVGLGSLATQLMRAVRALLEVERVGN